MPLCPKYASVSNVKLYALSPFSAVQRSSRVWLEKGEEGFQLVTRPSEFVVALNFKGSEEVVEEGLRRVKMTGMEAPGRPMVVSRTWHVIGGFFSVDMVWFMGVGAVVNRWFDSASMRCVAVEAGMQRVRWFEKLLLERLEMSGVKMRCGDVIACGLKLQL
jgi:hypothetical protein